MKCTRCGTDNNLKDRTANYGRCKNCRHTFVFEPTSMSGTKFTDPFFAKVLADISVNNTLFFTARQFLYFLEKRLRKKSFSETGITALVGCNIFGLIFSAWILSQFLRELAIPIGLLLLNLVMTFTLYGNTTSHQLSYQQRKKSAKTLFIWGFVVLVGGAGLSIALAKSYLLFTLYTLLGITAIYLGWRQSKNIQPSSQNFLLSASQVSEWLGRWTNINGSLAKQLPPSNEQLPATTINSEIRSYSFDRVVVCDSDEIAQFLIANNFHFEHNCAVLSIDRYPQTISDTVLEMLKRNSELKVYALHNASPFGVTLLHQLRTNPEWFANHSATIYDIGISPKQVLKHPNFFICNTVASASQARALSPEIRQQLTPEEIQWLEVGNFIELESFSPQQLLKLVTQGIALSNSSASDDSLVLIDTPGFYGVYTVDSFG